MRKEQIFRLSACFAGIGIIAGLTGCSYVEGLTGQGRQEDSIRIGICVNDGYDTHLMSMVSSMSAWQKELEQEKGVTIITEVVNAGGSQLKQNDQVERFIDKGFDILCVNLVDRTDAISVIDKARNADLPVVFFNRELVEEDLHSWDRLYYVGVDPRQAGRMQGEIVTAACRERFEEIDQNDDGILQYVILEGEPNHQDAILRTQTSVSTIKAAGYMMEKLGDEIANWNRAQAKTKMSGLLDQYPDRIELIIANNDEMAMGALSVLESRSGAERPLVVGVDGNPDVLDMVKAKYMEGTVYNDADGQAEAIIKIACALATKEEIPEDINLQDGKYVILPHQIIDFANVQEFITGNLTK